MVIESEPIIKIGNSRYVLTLPPNIFFQIINLYKIDFPFNYENKIIELKTLIIKENIEINDALEIIKNLIKEYFNPDAPLIFGPQILLLNKLLEMSKSQITGIQKFEEIIKYHIELSKTDINDDKFVNLVNIKTNKELFEQVVIFQNSLVNKRNKIIEELITKITAESSKEIIEDTQESDIKLAHREIALLCYYTGSKITSNNADGIAKKYRQSSGSKLLEHYNLISTSDLNITNHRFAVKNIEKVLTFLNDNPKAKEKAEKELKVANQIKK